MRLLWSLLAFSATATSVAAFSIQNNNVARSAATTALNQVVAADVQEKQAATLEKLSAKDSGANAISKDVSFSTYKLMCGVYRINWLVGRNTILTHEVGVGWGLSSSLYIDGGSRPIKHSIAMGV